MKSLISVCIFAVLLSLVPQVTYAAAASPEEISTFCSLFNIRDRNVAKNIIVMLKEKYGLKDVARERIIDAIAQKHHTTVEQLLKDGSFTMNLGTLAPANTPWIRDSIESITPFINYEYRGLYRLKTYAGGVMGEDNDVLKKMRSGELQACGCTAQGVIKADPELSVFTLPLLFKDYKQVDCVLDGMRNEIAASFRRHGYILNGLIHTGFFYTFTKNRVTSLAELRQQKINTWFGKVEDTYLDELGIKYTPIDPGKVVSSLQKGVINATTSPPVWFLGVQGFVYMKYYLSFPVFYSPAAIFIDKKQIDAVAKRFPPGVIDEVVSSLDDFIRLYEPEWRGDIVSFDQKSMDAFRGEGLQPENFSAADLNTMRKAAVRTREKLSGVMYSKDLLNKVMSEIKQCGGE